MHSILDLFRAMLSLEGGIDLLAVLHDQALVRAALALFGGERPDAHGDDDIGAGFRGGH